MLFCFLRDDSNRSNAARFGTKTTARNSSCPSTAKCFQASASSQSLESDL